jgi:hypothetical protein
MMATSPKMPDFPNIPPRKPVDEHVKLHTLRRNKFPWLVLTVLVAAALLAVIIAVLPGGPHLRKPPVGAQVPAQPTATQIQLTNVQLVPAPVGDAVYLSAVLHNVGDYDITGVQVNAQFMGNNGVPAGAETGAAQSANGTSTEDLTKAPIKPNESRPIHIYFEHTPKGWNHELPEVKVTTVTGTTG